MASVYKNDNAQREVRAWCVGQIADWGIAHVRREVVTPTGVTGVVTTGPEPREGEPSVVLLPGTNMNAALCLPLVEVMARNRRVVILDLPGQPGLSTGRRPDVRRMAWYGNWLTEALTQTVPGPVVAVGHSLGARSRSPRMLRGSSAGWCSPVPASPVCGFRCGCWPPPFPGSCCPPPPGRRGCCAGWLLRDGATRPVI